MQLLASMAHAVGSYGPSCAAAAIAEMVPLPSWQHKLPPCWSPITDCTLSW